MYKYVTTTNPFIITYLTTLNAYIKESIINGSENLDVLEMFGLDNTVNIETYDPIGNLVSNNSGNYGKVETAYKETIYLGILINALLKYGKTQTDIMDSIIT